MQHKYIPVIDGLRAVAILLVIAAHYLHVAGAVPGGFGVTIFFFISGYLITGLLIDEINSTGRINLLAFYWRRFRRLAPAMLFMLAVIASVYWFWLGRWSTLELVAGATYWMNYYEMWNELMGWGMPLEIGVLWSLAVEEHFYLLFPAVIALFWRFGRALLVGLAAVCAMVLLWRFYLVLAGNFEVRTYAGTDTRIDSILWGCVLTVALKLKMDLRWLAHPAVLLIAVLTLLGTLVIRDPIFRQTLRYTDQGMAFIPLMYWLVYCRPKWPTWWLSSAPMIWIGKLSYSLYLWHFPVLDLCKSLPAPWPAQKAVAIAVMLAMAVFSYYCVEKPLRYGSRRLAASSMASGGAV